MTNPEMICRRCGRNVVSGTASRSEHRPIDHGARVVPWRDDWDDAKPQLPHVGRSLALGIPRGVAGNLSGSEAATLAKEIGAGLVIPCHYEMFEFNTATTDEFVTTARELDQPIQVLRAGERFSF